MCYEYRLVKISLIYTNRHTVCRAKAGRETTDTSLSLYNINRQKLNSVCPAVLPASLIPAADRHPLSPDLRFPVLFGLVTQFTDTYQGIRNKKIGGHRQIEGCRHEVVDPAGEIVTGAVAGTVEATLPGRPQIGRSNIGPIAGYTTQVCTDSHHHEIFRFQ